MTTIKQDSHVYRLLTFLSYVGEYPLCSLQLFGSKEVWRKLIHKHSQRQEYRIPGHAEKITCRLLLITGKGNETRQKYGTIYADCRTDVEYVKEYLEEYNHSPSHVLENQNLD